MRLAPPTEPAARLAGWHDSSFDLRRGLDVLELWEEADEAPPRAERAPAGAPVQATARFTAAPRSSTAIA